MPLLPITAAIGGVLAWRPTAKVLACTAVIILVVMLALGVAA